MRDIEKALLAQRDQLNKLELLTNNTEHSLKNAIEAEDDFDKKMTEAFQELNELQNLLLELNIQNTEISNENLLSVETEDINSSQKINVNTEKIQVKKIHITSWEQYSQNVDHYLFENNIKISDNILNQLLTPTQQKILLGKINDDYSRKIECDSSDYIIATFSGILSGLIDVFFVGSPKDSKLQKWGDKKVDNTVIKFTKLVYKYDEKNGGAIKSKRKGITDIASAIGYLEERFKVNYDASTTDDLVGNHGINITPSNHHLKSLAHSPDIIGLFFSILDQFTGKASFTSDGKVLRVNPNSTKFELEGGNVIAKIFAGFVNWLGHIMSDVSGSSGLRRKKENARGAGIPLPFFNLLQLLDNDKKNPESIGKIALKVYEDGYDLRFGVAMSVPVMINEMLIRFMFSFKSYFIHKKSFVDSIPKASNPTLNRMLLVGYGALCLTDGVDAALKSKGNKLLFASRLNYVAWIRFAFTSIKALRFSLLEGTIDLKKLEQDLELEWKKLLDESSQTLNLYDNDF